MSLDGNAISMIEPGTFDALTTLKYLGLGSNSISFVQSGLLTGLSLLVQLDLRLNKISTIEGGAFDDLYSLRLLFLFQNRLSTLRPGLFTNMPRSLSLEVTNPTSRDLETNAFICRSMCWLKHEVQKPPTTIAFPNHLVARQPVCVDVHWSNLQCGNPGKFNLHKM